MTPAPTLHVAAAVITDARGRILLARRTAGRDLAGLWEFPGGKREAGESTEAALARELEEELGIHVEVGPPLACVPFACPDKRLRLDVRRVDAWQGIPKGREGQALAWVPRDKLHTYAMPPADRPVVAILQQPDRYLVTPLPGPGPARAADHAWSEGLQAALDAGIRRVLLRLPGLEASRRHGLASRAVGQCRDAGAQVLVGGDADLARALGVGLHLRAAQLMACAERPLPAESPLAASCHDASELQHAERIGCDFAVLGPLRATPTHPEARGIGWAAFARMRERVSLPIYAIGGMTAADITDGRQHGAQGIAAIRGLWPIASGTGTPSPRPSPRTR
ncbi:Nudix family hydrolase [Luteimonas vadosa]|uniref:8-oxo-dGTP diphosphatase n=1 Tax=Luteimonas vadosa TaxID=1165507 RepID=A0ABP9DRJ6_9GAMM